MMDEKQRYEESKKQLQLPSIQKPGFTWDVTLLPLPPAFVTELHNELILEMARLGVSPWDVEMVFKDNVLILRSRSTYVRKD
ncbi:MAG: hypothetical protein KME52_11825 [Desmonostoc geniculatum HA4340-LM1]|jgi:hypothetical protein|nr:hypothetical protein [Desmonostoc geniculatum HA4340-LM1]